MADRTGFFESEVQMVRDSVAPTVSAPLITPNPVPDGSSASFSATYSDEGGVVFCELFVGGVNVGRMGLSGGTASRSYRTSAGTYPVTVSCVDVAGNNGVGMGEVTFLAPPPPPASPTVSPPLVTPNPAPARSSVSISATYSAGVTSCSLFVNGVSQVPAMVLSGGTATASLTRPAGTYSVNVSCNDAAGRVGNGSALSVVFTAAAAPPGPAPASGSRPNVDESINGGYWPFESDVFSVDNFLTAGINNEDHFIFLAPRVGPGETLVIHTWDGELVPYCRPTPPPGSGTECGHFLDSHVLLPKEAAFSTETADAGRTILYHDPPVTGRTVLRDVGRGIPGNANLDSTPHARLYCFHTNSNSEECTNFVKAPVAMMFKRGDWSLNGDFRFFLVDYWADFATSYRYFSSVVTSTVRIVTQDRIYTVRPPSTPPSDLCRGTRHVNGADDSTDNWSSGKYWYVFSEGGADGSVHIKNEFHCTGEPVDDDPVPGPATFPLPGPGQLVNTVGHP